MSLTFNVTKRDWKAAKRWAETVNDDGFADGAPAFCPLAQAIRRKIGRPLTNGWDITVNWMTTTIDGVRYTNGDKARYLIDMFDMSETPEADFLPVKVTLFGGNE